jgi:hypothetical protein
VSIWAGIKYALNSTLGTGEFKSLDKQIDDVLNNYHLEIANVDVTLNTALIGRNDTEYTVRYDGTIYWTAKFRNTENYVRTCTSVIFINGERISYDVQVPGDTSRTFGYSANVKKGDRIRITGSAPTWSYYTGGNIYGNVVIGAVPLVALE